MFRAPGQHADIPETKQRRYGARRRGFVTGVAFVSAWIVWHFAVLHSFDLVVSRDTARTSAGIVFRIPGTDEAGTYFLPAAPGQIEITRFTGSARRQVVLLAGHVDSFGQFHPRQQLQLEGSLLTRGCAVQVEIRDGTAIAHSCVPHAMPHWHLLY